MNTQKIKPDPKPSWFPEIIVLNIMGAIAKTVRQDLGFRLGEDLPRQSDYAAFMAEHQKVHSGLGFHPQIRDPKYVFSEFEVRNDKGGEQKGVPNVNIGSLVAELYERGYYLIDAGARVDDRKRDVVRLTFSVKESDRKLAKASPSRDALVAYFRNRTYGFCHVWDRRWVRVDTGEQMGNMTIAVCGNEPRPQDCMTYRILRVGDRGANKGEPAIVSFDVARRPPSVAAPAKKRTTAAPTLTATIGERVNVEAAVLIQTAHGVVIDSSSFAAEGGSKR